MNESTWTILLDRAETAKEGHSVHRCIVLNYEALEDTHMEPCMVLYQFKYISDCLHEQILVFHIQWTTGASLEKQTKALPAQTINTKCMKI
jgi:hypothetical protein